VRLCEAGQAEDNAAPREFAGIAVIPHGAG
jgi:hypothetical protein